MEQSERCLKQCDEDTDDCRKVTKTLVSSSLLIFSSYHAMFAVVDDIAL